MTVDAIVIGAGPNGLVAANLLADAGWDVLVLEAQPEPGGAVRSAELTVPGFCHDRFSAFYPLAAVSPALASLELERHGLVWRRASTPLAHVFADGRAAVLSSEIDRTADSVDSFALGDGAEWRALVADWQAISDPLLALLLGPVPSVGATMRLLARLRRPSRLLDLARTALLPVRRLAQERFQGEGAAMLLAGNTMHTDLSPESALGGFYGWMLAMLAQTVGFPVPEGGSGALTAALVRRLEATGGRVRCDAEVSEIVVRSGAATGVRLADDEHIDASRAVLADVIATRLYGGLVASEHLPARVLDAIQKFDLDHGTFKVDWALREPVPWTDAGARDAGTVHLGDDMDHLTRVAADLSIGRLPENPFVLFGQMSRADPTRSPAGTETAWAYTHVPNPVLRPDAVVWDVKTTAAFAERLEEEVERRAPGFRDTILGRHVMSPAGLEATNANLVGGAINAGTAQLHQQLVFRPIVGPAGPRTPIDRLFLASASAHPGGGVHGVCGANAARAALGPGHRLAGRFHVRP